MLMLNNVTICYNMFPGNYDYTIPLHEFFMNGFYISMGPVPKSGLVLENR